MVLQSISLLGTVSSIKGYIDWVMPRTCLEARARGCSSLSQCLTQRLTANKERDYVEDQQEQLYGVVQCCRRCGVGKKMVLRLRK